MNKKFRYFIAIPLTELESKHLGIFLKETRVLLDMKQCRLIEKTPHCDSTISDLERQCKNPYFQTIQNYLKGLGVEFYAFVPADTLAADAAFLKTELLLVKITPEELIEIRKSA